MLSVALRFYDPGMLVPNQGWDPHPPKSTFEPIYA
jgi:hypothetical protein